MDEAIDYSTDDVARSGRFDVIVDLVGGAGMASLADLLAPAGRLISAHDLGRQGHLRGKLVLGVADMEQLP